MSEPQPSEERLAEWTGLFLFAIGAYGSIYRPYTRHLALWGVIPLDAFYASLLLGGAVLMLWASPWAPFRLKLSALDGRGRAVLIARRAFGLLMIALLFWLVVLR
jgi:hypothetical protein